MKRCPTCGAELAARAYRVNSEDCAVCRAERNVRPAPTFGVWCPKCAEYALPMHNGTCGFCDTRIVAA